MTAALAQGFATLTADGTILDAWYPTLNLVDTLTEPAGTRKITGGAEFYDDLRQVTRVAVRTAIADLQDPPSDVYDAYLRLHLISARQIAPHGCNLDGIFSILSNVVWTSCGPCAVEGFEKTRERLMAAHGQLTVYSVDKFPRMVDYVIPSGVRIGDADRVRLGAHLAEGTTVMHEGFVNFNAGTLGSSMVEGRISGGVVVGDGSDIGGGASIMGTLSGGGKQVISIGKKCLLGANSGVGISLGDNVTVEAGLYLTFGTKVTVYGIVAEEADVEDGTVVKAAELSGRSNILFRRNSVSGAVEAIPAAGGVELNEELHKN